MSDNRAEDRAAIQEVLMDSYKAWETGDAGGMVANYTADATAIMTGSLRCSRDVIRETMAGAFAGPLKDTSTYNKQLSLRFVGRDAAIAVSESGILFAGETEVPDPRKVNATWVFEEAGRPVADRGLSQQSGAGGGAVSVRASGSSREREWA